MKKLLTASILLMMFILTSCSELAEQPVTLTFWSTTDGEETTFFQERINAFQKEHPNVKVTMVQVPFATASNQFKTAMLGSQTIDVFRSDNSWIPEYADLDILYPLNTLASDADLSSYVESALKSDEYQGNLYGLPSVLEAPALLYNKRLLKEAGYSTPPATMDDLFGVAKAVTQKNRYGIYISENSYYALPYLWAFGGGTITDDRKIEIASEDSKKGFEFMLKLRQEKVTQPYPDFTDSYNKMMNDFKEGKSAMIINGPWAVTDVLTGSEFKDATNLGISQIPKGPKGQGSPIGGHSLVISKYSKVPQEAYELIRYLTSAETQLLQSQKLKTLPTQVSVYEDEMLASDPIVQGFKEQVDTAKARPLIPEGAQMFNDFSPNLTDILLGKQTVQEGVTHIETAWKSLLKID
ncbi:arabinogalactan oligomer/maltooligosaccharide transport system substrate-binding protein [Paenibacillus sp. DS2015]|uniref:extracellular solute-binding protein n=1 Tax=Paenibacillus sp. DS2015 TaxID=3373917 RepID=UPI003D23C941